MFIRPRQPLPHRVTLVLHAAVLLTLAAPALGASAVDSLDDARRNFREAELAVSRELREELYGKAESLAREALVHEPWRADAHFIVFASMGRRLLDKGVGLGTVIKLSRVRRYLDTVLELDPSHAQALSAKGGILLDLPPILGGNLEEAFRYLERAVRLNPTGSGTRLTMGRALLRRGDTEEAREQLRLAAHYACLTGRTSLLKEAQALLDHIAAISP